jgi:hypothetical protein
MDAERSWLCVLSSCLITAPPPPPHTHAAHHRVLALSVVTSSTTQMCPPLFGGGLCAWHGCRVKSEASKGHPAVVEPLRSHTHRQATNTKQTSNPSAPPSSSSTTHITTRTRTQRHRDWCRVRCRARSLSLPRLHQNRCVFSGGAGGGYDMGITSWISRRGALLVSPLG